MENGSGFTACFVRMGFTGGLNGDCFGATTSSSQTGACFLLGFRMSLWRDQVMALLLDETQLVVRMDWSPYVDASVSWRRCSQPGLRFDGFDSTLVPATSEPGGTIFLARQLDCVEILARVEESPAERESGYQQTSKRHPKGHAEPGASRSMSSRAFETSDRVRGECSTRRRSLDWSRRLTHPPLHHDILEILLPPTRLEANQPSSLPCKRQPSDLE